MNFAINQPPQNQFHTPKIQNVVGTFTLDTRQNFKLTQIASRWNTSRYNRIKFSGLIARNDKPKATFMVFSNGKVIVTGVKSQNQCLLSSSKLIKKMSKFGALKSLKPKQKLQINNVVATINTRMKINLQAMSNKNPHCQFNPQTFPGLIYRMNNPKITFLIFTNGKVIITGAKSQTQATTGFRNLYKVLKQHRVLSQNILTIS